MSWSSKDITRPYGAHSSDKASDVVYGCHDTLHVGGRIPEGMQEILRDDDISEDALVVTVEAIDF